MRMCAWLIAVSALFISTAAQSQSEFAAGKPSVQVLHIESAPLQKGKAATVTMNFRVAKGFHINSNHPNSELLIPTAVKLDAPTDLSLGNVQYPEGEQVSFAFAPDEKLSVYTGDFMVQATARTIGEIRPGSYRVHGELKYQACDNSACYPPKSMPIAFDIKVGSPPRKPHHNPAQSPGVHN